MELRFRDKMIGEKNNRTTFIKWGMDNVENAFCIAKAMSMILGSECVPKSEIIERWEERRGNRYITVRPNRKSRYSNHELNF